MLAIRLTRIGKKNSPAYRVVVADKKRAVQRKFIEVLGHYNPALKPKQLGINKERAVFWINRGAQPSATVHNLMVDLGILDKKVNKTYAKKKAEEVVSGKPVAAEKTEETEVKTAETEESAVSPEEAVIKTAGVEEEPEIGQD